MTLAETQRAFLASLPSRETGLLSLSHSNPVAANIGFAVYAGNQRGALNEALRAAYPICEWLVGNDYFGQLATHYFKQHPEKSCDLNQVGSIFPHWLKHLCNSRSELETLQYLPAVAEYEQLHQRMYYADTDEPFPFAAFAALSNEERDGIRFTLSKSAAVLTTDWDVLSIRQAWKAASEEPLLIEQRNHYLLINRSLEKVATIILETEAAEFLLAIGEGFLFSDLVEDFPEQLNELGAFITSKVIGGFK